MIFWALYKRSAIAHGTGGNKRGLAVLKVLDYVSAERSARSSSGKVDRFLSISSRELKRGGTNWRSDSVLRQRGSIANRDSRPTGTGSGVAVLGVHVILDGPERLDSRRPVRRASRPTSC
jgi:hypothetical protein